MVRTLANFIASLVLFSFVFILAALALPAQSQEASTDILMAEQAAPLRRVADRFVEHALAGDAAALQSLFSPALVERTGPANVQRVLQQQILPFFAQGREPGRSVTITRTTDASGSQGFAFYMWLLPASGGPARPFTVYTVVENGRPVVANIVPDRLVQGRHQ